MELRKRDVQPRQEYRNKKREVLHQTDKSGVVGAVGVVVNALEFLDKEVRNDHHGRRTVDNHSYPALGQLAADRVRTFGYAHSRKQTSRALVLQIFRQVARRENRFKFAVVQSVFQLVEQVERNLRLKVTEHELGFAVRTDSHLLKFEVGRFHPTPYHRHIYPQRLGKALP